MKLSQKCNLWKARVKYVVTITKECNTQGAPTHSLIVIYTCVTKITYSSQMINSNFF